MTPDSPTDALIKAKCEAIAAFLVQKNRAYGDSVLRPEPTFAGGRPEDLIRVRIDDKLNRIRNARDAYDEDPIWDLTGYLVLLLIARDQAKRTGDQQ